MIYEYIDENDNELKAETKNYLRKCSYSIDKVKPPEGNSGIVYFRVQYFQKNFLKQLADKGIYNFKDFKARPVGRYTVNSKGEKSLENIYIEISCTDEIGILEGIKIEEIQKGEQCKINSINELLKNWR